MKKITLLFFAMIALIWHSNAQVTTPQNFGANGPDSAPTVLTINSGDITVNGSAPIDAISLGTFTTHYSSPTGGTTYCNNWYAFDLAVTGGVADGTSILAGCDTDFNGLDITGFTTITITSDDIDNVTDTVYFDIDLDVTYTPVTPPNCDSLLNQTVDVPLSGDISWSEATGGHTGYFLVVGTGTGLDDVVNTDVGNVTTYNVGTLMAGTTYYATITPYNGNGNATGCTEQTFVAFNPVQGDTFNDPLPITPSAEGIACDTAAYTFSYDFSTGVSDSGTSSTCGSTSTFDMFFSWTATTDALLWNDGGSNPGVAVYDTLGNQIDCLGAFAATNAELSGWSIGDNLIIQVYDFGTTGTNPVSFCLAEFTLPEPPSNDTCAGVIDLGTLTSPLTASTVGATNDFGSFDCFNTNNQSPDIVYSILVPNGYTLTIGQTSNDYDSEHRLGYGGACPGDTSVACTDDSDTTTESWTNDTGADETAYWIQSAYSTASGTFTLAWSLTPANDECATAEALTLGTEISADNTGATDSGVTGDCFTGAVADLWYSFVAPVSGEVTITTSAAQYGVYTDCAGTLVGACNTSVVGDLTNGTTYYVRVSDDGTARAQAPGAFTLMVSESTSLSTAEFNSESLFAYYPNPVNDNLTLKAQKEISNVSVYNMLGQEVYRNAPNSVDNLVNMSDLQSGAYFVKVTIDNVTETIKVIKK
ncbi:T9SS type A sorting domain-containing protein [Olleya marilimosa]|uniref:T9SS type A sorting domain-containing protein n=1 Tax=Olleya marilimosa TaxID=272164 RepID=UPI000481265E|nr:T9SS type A sorting domain-containing protein [Olleya marilimosa]